MGVKLIILLALIVGALYSIHLLAQDYQSIRNPARLLFKRHLNSSNEMKPTVRWKQILQHDPLTCARALFCELGSSGGALRGTISDIQKGLIYMISIEPTSTSEHVAYKEFYAAYSVGVETRHRSGGKTYCRERYFMCPFRAAAILDLVDYLIHKKLL